MQQAGREWGASEPRENRGGQITWKLVPSGGPERLDFTMHRGRPTNAFPGRGTVGQEFARTLRTPWARLSCLGPVGLDQEEGLIHISKRPLWWGVG